MQQTGQKKVGDSLNGISDYLALLISFEQHQSVEVACDKKKIKST